MPNLASCLLSLAAAATPAPSNLAFETGRLVSWEGEGFRVTTAAGSGPSLSCAVISSDCGGPGRTALLHRSFTVPTDAALVRFTAAAVRPSGREPAGTLEVVLEAAGRKSLPRKVRTAQGPRPAGPLGPLSRGGEREYVFDVSAHAGQTVRLALIDDDARPGCYLYCSGFRILDRLDVDGRAFAAHMTRLQAEYHLPAMRRFETKHFMAISSADEDYTEHRLHNCETMYGLFFEHFRKKGFTVRTPPGHLMVAIFDSQAGFEVYLGRRLSDGLTGVYHKPSNRLVVYDYGTNRTFQAGKKAGEQQARQIGNSLDRGRVLTTFGRKSRENRDDANVGTIMHEVAHQLSFNCGLLNRDGDVPVWLAEGLATYCEPTAGGAWQGIGESNPQRIQVLAAQFKSPHGLLPLRVLLDDAWLSNGSEGVALLGYAQSWALFRMLITERPRALKTYLEMIHDRRTEDHRLSDFVAAFGDLGKLEKRHVEYAKEISSGR